MKRTMWMADTRSVDDELARGRLDRVVRPPSGQAREALLRVAQRHEEMAEAIRAWLDGKPIESWNTYARKWMPVESTEMPLLDNPYSHYRVIGRRSNGAAELRKTGLP